VVGLVNLVEKNWQSWNISLRLLDCRTSRRDAGPVPQRAFTAQRRPKASWEFSTKFVPG
jgi:hypothetical protein